MFPKQVRISKECMGWLEKAESFDVYPQDAMKRFEGKCERIQDDVLRALSIASKEPATLDGKTDIVIEVKLVRARKLNLLKVVTNVYAVVNTKKNKKYYVMLDDNRKPKKFTKMGDELFISTAGGKFFEQMNVVESKKFRISM